MAVLSFDCTHAVRFDLPRGTVHAKGDAERIVLVPAAALDRLLREAPVAAAEEFATALGAAVGHRVLSRLADAQSASVDAFVTQWAGEAAMAGVGVVAVERWGRALIVVVSGSPFAQSVLLAFVSSAIEAACGLRPACTLLADEQGTARIFVGSQAGVDRLRASLASGRPWADAIERLNRGES
ncbi:MAG: hypothetical protein ABTD50_16320 [Polyangiaceae bacterium]|jgi:hypothetical protein